MSLAPLNCTVSSGYDENFMSILPQLKKNNLHALRGYGENNWDRCEKRLRKWSQVTLTLRACFNSGYRSGRVLG